jgi:hypothetical protein
LADKEELIKEYSSYNTKLTQQDIVLAFPGNVISYLSKARFYLCDYTVYQGESEQNYAWHFKIIKNSYKWGTIYTLQLHISNGFLDIKTSTSDFTAGDKNAERFYWAYESVRHEICECIVREFRSFVQESLITMKQHDKNYDMESQKALAYVITEFLPELSPNRKRKREAKRESYLKIENEVELEMERDGEAEAYRKAYQEAMRKAMRGS